MKLINKNLITRLPFCAVLLACSATFAPAQSPKKDDYPKFEVFVGASALGDNAEEISFGGNMRAGGGYANSTGFETSVTRNFSKYVGLKGDFSAHFRNRNDRNPVAFCNPTCSTVTQDTQLKTRVYDFLAGPEFKARNSTRLTPFAYALGGVAHTSAAFTTPGPTFNLLLKKSNNGFAMALGGGLDLRVTDKFSIRGSMDYNPVFIQDSTGNHRNFARISLGVLIH